MLLSVIASAGIALVVAAIAANQPWLDRHFLPSFLMPRDWYVAIETTVRVCIGGVGGALVLARAPIARLLTRAPALALQAALAAALAVPASEIVLRRMQVGPTEWLMADTEPKRIDDPMLGWVLAPSRVGRIEIGGRAIEYAVDAAGYRVRALDQPVDPARPAIVFTGESVMFGEGLTWDESIPAQAGAMLGIESANIAVHGYSTDQSYLRLARELPRFRQPTAVIAIFMTELFGRNLNDDQPHLAPGLVWQPAEHGSRVRSLAELLVPYHRDATIELGVRTSGEALRAIVQLARARGATPLVVIPQFGGESEMQQTIRARVVGAEMPSLMIPLDPAWRVPWNRHPDARAAHVIAAAIANRLRRL